MQKTISSTDISKRKTEREGYLTASDEMSYPDWRAKLRRAKKQLDAGEGIDLEALLREEKQRSAANKASRKR